MLKSQFIYHGLSNRSLNSLLIETEFLSCILIEVLNCVSSAVHSKEVYEQSDTNCVSSAVHSKEVYEQSDTNCVSSAVHSKEVYEQSDTNSILICNLYSIGSIYKFIKEYDSYSPIFIQ